jgi:hypothetical protein
MVTQITDRWCTIVNWDDNELMKYAFFFDLSPPIVKTEQKRAQIDLMRSRSCAEYVF